MPDRLVRSEFEKCDGDIAAMSRRFQVSKEAMRYALQNLGLVETAGFADIPPPKEE
jgi:Zn-dependent peptidase ImmA (M78 family)